MCMVAYYVLASCGGEEVGVRGGGGGGGRGGGWGGGGGRGVGGGGYTLREHKGNIVAYR
jgi:hypothetical protein